MYGSTTSTRTRTTHYSEKFSLSDPRVQVEADGGAEEIPNEDHVVRGTLTRDGVTHGLRWGRFLMIS